MSVSPLQNPRPRAANALLDAFPGRAMVVHYAGVLNNALWMAAAGLLFAALTVGSAYFSLPDIISDMAMNGPGEAVVETDASVQGECKRMKFVFIDCSAKITYRPDPSRADVAEVEQSFLFLGTDYSTTVDVLRSKARPSRVTTTLATEHLGNRMFTLLALCLILGGLTVSSFYAAWSAMRWRRLEGTAVGVRPVIATIVKTDEHRNVTFEARIDGATVKRQNRLRDGDQPLFLPSGNNQVLAVVVTGTRHLILLDDALSVLDFSDGERAQIRAALG